MIGPGMIETCHFFGSWCQGFLFILLMDRILHDPNIVYSGSRKVGTCPQEQIGPKPQVPTLILESKVGTWSETRQSESWNMYCTGRERERGTANTTTAPVLQKKRNYNCYDRSSIGNREKLQSLRTLQCCKERELQLPRPFQCCRETETAITTTAPVQYCRERNCNYCDASSVAEREELELLDLSRIATIEAEIETVITATLPAWQRGNCN